MSPIHSVLWEVCSVPLGRDARLLSANCSNLTFLYGYGCLVTPSPKKKKKNWGPEPGSSLLCSLGSLYQRLSTALWEKPSVLCMMLCVIAEVSCQGQNSRRLLNFLNKCVDTTTCFPKRCPVPLFHDGHNWYTPSLTRSPWSVWHPVPTKNPVDRK